MKKLAFNPYLPSWEYIPDGEPRVFGNRLYVYGSHDRARGEDYCMEDYVVWSAPLDNLGDWKYEGVVYKREQDPDNHGGKDRMYAPDVVQGPDGRYYMYYGTSIIEYTGVAVSDSPAGPFEYYGKVLNKDGSHVDGVEFDPGVLVQGEDVYLYYGFSPEAVYPLTGNYSILKEIMPGAYAVRLDKDMKTAISKPIQVANGWSSAKGTCFETHPFFEASSIRYIRDKYYFVYSSLQGHELCYAVSDSPEGPFEFGGVIISNGDVGITEEPRAYMGNNHGGIVEIDGQYYIFYHRHTHGIQFCRQGCAEKITILEDGSIPQVEITSCGLNNRALPAKGEYSSYIICNLHGQKPAYVIPYGVEYDVDMPRLVETEEEKKEDRTMYLCNLQQQSVCGVKYLEFQGEEEAMITCRGSKGQIQIILDEENSVPIAVLCTEESEKWATYTCKVDKLNGVHAVYFRFIPMEGSMDFLKFGFGNPHK